MKLFLFIFFLFINCNTIVKSLKITDLTTKSTLSQYSDGPSQPNSCTFLFVFSLGTSDTSSYIRYTPNFSQTPLLISTSPSNKNDTIIYNVQLISNKDNNGLIVANYTFGEIFSNGTIISSEVIINVYCSDPPLPGNSIVATDFSLYNNKYMVSYFSIYSWNRNMVSLSFIENLKPELCDSDCRIVKSDNFYIIYMKIINFDTITFSINSTYHNNFNFNLTINGIFKNTKSKYFI
ncbi:hypothetical protein ACTA71_012138 [Dictyostelium dimigraforme]